MNEIRDEGDPQHERRIGAALGEQRLDGDAGDLRLEREAGAERAKFRSGTMRRMMPATRSIDWPESRRKRTDSGR